MPSRPGLKHLVTGIGTFINPAQCRPYARQSIARPLCYLGARYCHSRDAWKSRKGFPQKMHPFDRFFSPPSPANPTFFSAILCILALVAVMMNPQSIDLDPPKIKERAANDEFPPPSKELAEYILNVALRRGSPLIWSRQTAVSEDKADAVVDKTPTPPVMAKPGAIGHAR